MIDIGAFIATPTWLEVGWRLWEGVFPHRDFFMGLPSADRSAMRCIEARYSGSAAMSLALLASLRQHDGRPLLLRACCGLLWDGALRPRIGHINRGDNVRH